MQFSGKIALVTGASRGLGREIALGLAEEGAHVIINYSKSKNEAEDLKQILDSKNLNCTIFRCDVSSHSEVKNMFEKVIKEHEKIDILVNNAAIYKDSTVWKMDKEIWDEVIKTDLSSVFNCTKFAVSNMRQNGFGRIINISSVVGQTGGFGTSNYSAAKSGIVGFSKSVSKEVAQKGITVNNLSLGFIETGMLLRLPEKIQNNIKNQIPMKRWGKPSEVVSAVIFLCSEDAAYITGQTINVNGGYYV